MALTNNTKRGVDGGAAADEPNPRNNKNGQVLEIIDSHAGTTFDWNLLLVCEDPATTDPYFGGFDKSKSVPFPAPPTSHSIPTVICGSPRTAMP